MATAADITFCDRGDIANDPIYQCSLTTNGKLP